MGVRAAYTSPFPPLQLTEADRQQLEQVAQHFIVETIAKYEAHMLQAKRRVDLARWHLERDQDGLRIYAEKFSHGAAMETDHGREKPPVLMATGPIAGQLNDLMYGLVSTKTVDIRIKTSYTGDHLIDMAVLASVYEPTVTEPFRSLSVRWGINGQARHMQTVAKNRDLVCLEAVGMTTLPTTGETVGFHLMHSIEFPETKPLAHTTRGHISICTLYRQYNDAEVDVFATGVMKPAGRLMHAAVVKAVTGFLVSNCRIVYCAQMKKLAHALRRRRRERIESTSSSTSSASTSSLSRGDDKACAMCRKSLTGTAVTLGLKRAGVQCQLCFQFVCSACRVKKKLSAIGQDNALYRMQVPFCALCITESMHTDALPVAVDELRMQDVQKGYGDSVTGEEGDAIEKED